MGRGRKSSDKLQEFSWNHFYSKNIGFYLQSIIINFHKTNIKSVERGQDLLELITSNKKKSVNQFKKSKPITVEEIPFVIPENWAWCRLGEICSKIGSGSTPKGSDYSESGYPFFRSQNIYNDKLLYDDIKFINEFTHKKMKGTIVLANDILLNITGGSMGRCAHIPKNFIEGNVSQHVCIIRPEHVNNEFYHKLFLTPYFQSLIFSSTTGSGREGLPKYNLENFIVPLPPISEQSKIVAFLNALIDDKIVGNGNFLGIHIENQIINFHKQQIKAGEIYSKTSFQLTQLQNLNQAILQEAVQGKLVKQDPKDEPASELLKRIKAAKAKSFPLRGNKKGVLPPIKPEEIPFEIPENWVWCRLGEITDITMGQSPDGNSYNNKSVGVPLINGPVEFGGKGAFDETIAIKFTTEPTKYCKKGDLLICVRGSTTGRTNVAAFDACIGRGVAAIRGFFYEKFVYNYVLFVRYKIFGLGKGTTFPNLSQEQLNSVLVPLPPLSEQKRIVAEIEKQLAKTKQLKEHIIANQQATEQLLKALLHQAFEVEETEVAKPKGKVIELQPPNIPNLDNLAAEPFVKYAAQPANNIHNINWEMALMVACMKNFYNTQNMKSIFSKQYNFINSHFGTFSHELKKDLKQNPYLIAQKVAGNKEVYVVNPKYNTQILDKLTAPENKEFIQAINNTLSIYEHPFINKETDKIELYNTVLKIALDKNTRNIDVIYQGMKDWTIKQDKFKTKAEKFSKPDSLSMLNLLIEKGIL